MKRLSLLSLVVLAIMFLSVSCKKESGDGLSVFAVFVDGQIASFDRESLALNVLLPVATDFSNMNLSFRYSGNYVMVDGKKVTGANSKYTSNGSVSVDLDLSRPVTITVGNKKGSLDYSLSIKGTGLPIVKITTPGNIAITSKDVWLEGAELQIYNPDRSLAYEGGMSIRGRGNSTWNYVKKPYAIKLDSKSEILGMPKHKRWVLLANWKDRTILRNDAAFFLSRQTSLDYTVRGQFVEVELNGKHIGNYYLCEQIKIDKNRVNITPGYLMELDTYFDEENRFKSSIGLPWMFKEPDEDEITPEAIAWFKNYINELETLLKDETRVRNHEYEAYLDVDSAIEYMFVQELTNNTDFYNTWPSPGTHSCYMYKDADGKLMHGPLWDFDYHGFVPDYSSMWAGATKTLYYKYLYKDPKFRERMMELWAQDKPKFAKLPDYIDEMADKIRVSEGINHQMWPINTNSENGDEKMNFQAAVDRIKKGFTTKLDWMDKHLGDLK